MKVENLNINTFWHKFKTVKSHAKRLAKKFIKQSINWQEYIKFQ